jgi:hypothetical protein
MEPWETPVADLERIALERGVALTRKMGPYVPV